MTPAVRQRRRLVGAEVRAPAEGLAEQNPPAHQRAASSRGIPFAAQASGSKSSRLIAPASPDEHRLPPSRGLPVRVHEADDDTHARAAALAATVSGRR